MYTDKFGRTNIRDCSKMTKRELSKQSVYSKNDILGLSWDVDDPQDTKDKRIGVFLYVPYHSEPNHEHITFNRSEAMIMREWLTAFIEDTDV